VLFSTRASPGEKLNLSSVEEASTIGPTHFWSRARSLGATTTQMEDSLVVCGVGLLGN